MKHYIRYTIASLAIWLSLSCERDDICIDEITPKLIIRFYDFEKAASFSVLFSPVIINSSFSNIDD